MKKIEIACFNLESALIAQKAGADRIELCNGISVGGTTPSTKILIETRKLVAVDLFVMIRPRGGNFVYTEVEFQQMKKAIEEMKSMRVDGFVFGILNADNTINVEQNTKLVALAKPFPCTFHRAFDEVKDCKLALEEIIACGFTTVLTSGTKVNVTEGKNILKELVQLAKNRITIMPGGGLRSTNIVDLDNEVRADYYHSSAITDGGEIANFQEIIDLKTQLK